MISTKGRYALRMMIDLAEHDGERSVPLKDIAARQEISKKYLEIIAKELTSRGLIVGTSGKGGGYKLVRKPEEYCVSEILEVMEGSLSCVACLADPNYQCARRADCQTLPMWEEYDQLVRQFFNQKKLSDFLKPQ